MISVTDSESEYDVQYKLKKYSFIQLPTVTEISNQKLEESNFNSSVNEVCESEKEFQIAEKVVVEQLKSEEDKKMTGYYAYVQTSFEPHIVELLNYTSTIQPLAQLNLDMPHEQFEENIYKLM